MGIDTEQPRLSWELTATKRNQKQSAYQILVAGDSASLLMDNADIWNSGKVRSDQTNQIKGKALPSREYYYWKVRIWDKNGGVSDWSAITHWSAGLLEKEDWQAKWIGPAPQQIP